MKMYNDVTNMYKKGSVYCNYGDLHKECFWWVRFNWEGLSLLYDNSLEYFSTLPIKNDDFTYFFAGYLGSLHLLLTDESEFNHPDDDFTFAPDNFIQAELYDENTILPIFEMDDFDAMKERYIASGVLDVIREIVYKTVPINIH